MRMRWFHIGFVALMLLVPVRWAEAAPIFFDFTLNFTSGPLTGESYQGSFSVEGNHCTGIDGACHGLFSVEGPLKLLSFDVTVDGHAFSLVDAVVAEVSFVNDNPITWDYINSSVGGGDLLDIFQTNVFYGFSEGTIVSEGRQQQVVPEPASMLLLGIGLAGAGVRRWRQPRP